MLAFAFTITSYVLLGIVTLIYGFLRTRLLYWQRRGVTHAAPKLITGNLNDVGTARHMREVYREVYNDFRDCEHDFCGFYYLQQPAAFVLQSRLAKEILEGDSQGEEERAEEAALLEQLDESEMPLLRKFQSHNLSASLVADHLGELLKVGAELKRVFGELYAESHEVEMSDVMARYSIDTLGVCFYGLYPLLMNNRDVPCGLYNPQIFYGNKLSYALVQCIPKLRRIMQKRDLQADILDFENVPILLTLAFYELALNQEVQKRLRMEIWNVQAKYKGELTREALNEMPYSHQVIVETLRKYSIRPQLQRQTSNDLNTRTSGYSIQQGTLIIIPVDALHHDAAYFAEPNDFNPSRFEGSEALLAYRHAPWLPAAEEAQNSFGVNFALLQCRIALVALLSEYVFSVCKRTPQKLSFDARRALIAPSEEIFLRAESVAKE